MAYEKIITYKYVRLRLISLLNKLTPKMILLYNSYNIYCQTMTSVAKSKGIPVFELQHGAVGKLHGAYNYPTGINVETFPDYFLSWGKYHTNDVKLPIPCDRVIDVGFPYLDKFRIENKNKNKNRILILSQRRIDIGIFAKKLAENLPDFKILFKAHPSEYNYAQKNYDFFSSLSNIELISSDEKNLYELYSESSFVLGVNSTGMIESLAFEVKLIIIGLPGNEPFIELVDNNDVFFTQTPEDAVRIIQKLHKEPTSQSNNNYREYFFKTNSLKNISCVINDAISTN